jgi:hypothetical protein
MGKRLLPLLVATILTAMAVALTLAVVKNDATDGLEITGPGPSPSPPERGAIGKTPPAIDSASPTPDRRIPNRQPESIRSEPPAEANGPANVDRDPVAMKLEKMEAELDVLRGRIVALDTALCRAEEENARLKAELARAVEANAPFDPAKLPKRGEFRPTGEMVDNMEVFKPTQDEYWPRLRLETALHPEIRRYRIKWFSGKWSPWLTPGVDDEDSKTNDDGSRRRIWSYFSDHEFQVER